MLDPTFGNGGKVFTNFGGGSDTADAIALQPDGKIVAGGFIGRDNINFFTSFALARYNSDGSLDSTFGSGGKTTTSFFGYSDDLRAVVVQPDDRVVATGRTQTTEVVFSFDVVVARYGDAPFDLCIQDESNGNILSLNTATGVYQFTNCAGLTTGGTGLLTRRGSLITLQHNAADRRVMASIDTAASRASASLQLFSQGATLNITDRNITNNTCAFR